ncbi:MAG: M23 family metallopeptidase [Lachnospiraceae bacterium]|nr:M23 family metallopeptidase [Lachnospiraceae bacterium]
MFKYITKHSKRMKFAYIKAATIMALAAAFFLPSYADFNYEVVGNNVYRVTVNGEAVGTVSEPAVAEKLLKEVRRELALETTDLVFADVEMAISGSEFVTEDVDNPEIVRDNIRTVVAGCVKETMKRCYVVKVNDYMVNLNTIEEAQALLQAAINQFDTEGEFQVNLVQDTDREFNVLKTEITRKPVEEETVITKDQIFMESGIQQKMESMFENVEPVGEKTFEDYDLGLQSLSFSENVEIIEAYLDTSQLTPIDVAIEEVIKEQEVPGVYEVVAGDTLTEIAIKVNIPMDKIWEMNKAALPTLESTLHIGQELIITIPEPELSVEWQEQIYYEESYEADVIYIDNDSWYTTQTKVHQEASSGYRKVLALVSYNNKSETGREIVKQELVAEAVPKIVERGTKVPPTYIKPINGGRVTSSFGKRKAPTAGASTYHKGVDWAIPTGTKVVASSGGTVTKAGWASSGGYVVYIKHPDGRETRYKHLSKVLVKVGQKVKQGETIARSGNTGVSTGPHLHFEMWINGTAVNPVKYVK